MTRWRNSGRRWRARTSTTNALATGSSWHSPGRRSPRCARFDDRFPPFSFRFSTCSVRERVGRGRGRVRLTPPRERAAAGVYGCLWDKARKALSLGVRARAIRSTVHSTAQTVRTTRVRMEAGCAYQATIDGTHLARKPDGDRAHGKHRRSRFRHVKFNPADPAPARARCSALDACATVRTADTRSPYLPRREDGSCGAVVSANSGASASNPWVVVILLVNVTDFWFVFLFEPSRNLERLTVVCSVVITGFLWSQIRVEIRVEIRVGDPIFHPNFHPNLPQKPPIILSPTCSKYY